MLQAHPSICQWDIEVAEQGLLLFWELCRSDFSQAKGELEGSTHDWGGMIIQHLVPAIYAGRLSAIFSEINVLFIL